MVTVLHYWPCPQLGLLSRDSRRRAAAAEATVAVAAASVASEKLTSAERCSG